jgi:hypothetical protein
MRFVLIASVLVAACGGNVHNPGGQADGGGACSPEGSKQCSGASYQTCTNGTWVDTQDCPVACDLGLGCVQCQPNEVYCQSGDVWMCDGSGNPGSMLQACTGYAVCIDGACQDACADAAQNRSYIGCEYWAVDLDNALEVGCVQTNMGCVAFQQTSPGDCSAWTVYVPMGLVAETVPTCLRTQGNTTYSAGLCDPPSNSCPTGFTCNTTAAMCVLDAQHSPFAIVVSNPQAHDAHVVVTGPGGETINQTVMAGEVVPIRPQGAGVIPDESVDGTVQAKKAYEITSDLPIVAYQFNPLDNSFVFSNDASLLIPRTAFDTDYYVMSWPTLDRRNPAPGQDPYYGYLTVVAWQDNTQITVTPTAAVQASATQTTIAAGTPTTFTLGAFDVLQLEASGTGDLTGTHIVSTNSTSFGVFGGHEAADFGESTPPDSTHTRGPCCADHLEEMLFPSSTWGKTFAIARSQQRLDEPDYIRIMGQMAGTAVTFTPAPSAMVAGDCTNIGAGEFCDVKIQGDTEISSNNPILIGHLLESTIWQTSTGAAVGTGDPSLAIAVPTEQYRTSYTILVPNDYTANYLSISAAATGGVTVDGTAISLTAFPGGGTHRAARVPVAAGQHTIQCADGCGVLVYGWSDAVSYMFAGGLDLKQIVIL